MTLFHEVQKSLANIRSCSVRTHMAAVDRDIRCRGHLSVHVMVLADVFSIYEHTSRKLLQIEFDAFTFLGHDNMRRNSGTCPTMNRLLEEYRDGIDDRHKSQHWNMNKCVGSVNTMPTVS